MTTARNFSNLAPPLAFTAGVSSGAVIWPVASTAGYPDPPFLLAAERGTANEEIALCTDMASDSFTVERGYDDTEPLAHDVGKSIEHTSAAIDFREANAAKVAVDTHVALREAHSTVVNFPTRPSSPHIGEHIVQANFMHFCPTMVWDGTHWQAVANARVLAAPQHGLMGSLGLLDGGSWFMQFDSTVVSTNPAGGSSIFFPTPYPNGLITFVPTGGDVATGVKGVIVTPIGGQYALDHVGIICHNSDGTPIGSSLVRVNWFAWGT